MSGNIYMYACVYSNTTMEKQRTDAQELSPALKAMADPTRLRILLMLEPKARTVGEIVSFFDLSQPTISRHLQLLERAELVRRERRRQSVVYSLNSSIVKGICVSLAACFPCCCIQITTTGGEGMAQPVAVDPPSRIDHSASQRKEPS